MKRELVYVAGLLTVAGVLGASMVEMKREVPLNRATPGFVNFETPHVSPIAMTPDGVRLLAVNTPDNRLEVFSLASGEPRLVGSVPVGVDPVSVRARTNSEAWVVNHISDTISVVDLNAMNVVRTIQTEDEPCDVVFAGTPGRAFVTCSLPDLVQVFDAETPGAPIAQIDIEGEDPRMLAVSPDGATVYAAVYESGNGSTILGGGAAVASTIAFPPNVVNDADGPWGGVNPPPNDGAAFNPPQNGANPTPPRVGLIVRKDQGGAWTDDNGGDWTDKVSGADASDSGRQPGWDLLDHDVAMIDVSALSVSYASGVMNMNMALAVNPGSGEITVVGTEATNEVRFEPVLNGRFLRVNLGVVDPVTANSSVLDLNPHLTYTDDVPFVPIAQTERDKSLGDPRAIVWNALGTRGYVSGLGSNNVVVIDQTGARAGLSDTIEVGEGPTGLALDEARGRLYVLNKFDASISVIDTGTESETARVPFFDPTPELIRVGRKHLYDTHKNSGLGHVSCASCHVDARTDRIGWDLGAPDGAMEPFDQNCLDGGCQDWHPMKGPMTTQTLQDIIGLEPHHWRADRDGLEEFNPAFEGLLGDDTQLTAQEMQEFEDFLSSIHFPPNPFRNTDNSLPTSLVLDGHFTTGRFAPEGLPLPNGNALRGLFLYRTANLDGIECVTCHSLPTGAGPNGFFGQGGFQEIPDGPNGEKHHLVVSIDGSTNISIKVPQLRNMAEKTGFNTTQVSNTAGFGYLHDGSVDSIERFLSEPAFSVSSDQDVADLTAFMLAFSGSDLPTGSPTNPLEAPGPSSQDAHAAVGKQATLSVSSAGPSPEVTLINELVSLADDGDIGLIVKGVYLGEARGFVHVAGDLFQSDRDEQSVMLSELLAGAGPGAELTFTGVALGTEVRSGIDRDSDGYFDRDELDACADPADPLSTPATVSGCCPGDLTTTGSSEGDGGFGLPDGVTNLSDLLYFVNIWNADIGTPTPNPGSEADVTTTGSTMGDPGFGNPDGAVDLADLLFFVNEWTSGLGECPG